MLVLLLAGWILVAAGCALVLGRAVRSAEARERRVIPATLPEPSLAEAVGFVQTSLFEPVTVS